MCQESSLEASESRGGLRFASAEPRCRCMQATGAYIRGVLLDCTGRLVTLNPPALRAAPPVSALEGEALPTVLSKASKAV